MPSLPTGAVILPIRLNAKARRDLTWAAKREGLPLSTYLREAALEDAHRKRCASKAARAEALLAQREAADDTGEAA